MRWTGPVIATIDFLMSFAVCAVAMINPPETPKADVSDKRVCVMAIDIKWDKEKDIDVDLWVRGPREKRKAVGFGDYKTGTHMDLVRDDIGWPDKKQDGDNQERVCIKTFQDGEYIINLNLYSFHYLSPQDVYVSTTVSLVDPKSAFMEEIYSGEDVLTKDDEEITVIRFMLKDGKLVEGSERKLYRRVMPVPSAVTSDGPSGGIRRDR